MSLASKDWDLISNVVRIFSSANKIDLTNLVCTIRRYPDNVLMMYKPLVIASIHMPFGILSARHCEVVVVALWQEPKWLYLRLANQQ